MVEGDWLVSAAHAQFGVVKDLYGGLVNVTVYGIDGARIGRASPAMGGPRNYEPACNQEDWLVLPGRPKFPVRIWDLDRIRAEARSQ